ncbi:hypothetical protein BFP72_16840 [Reichenbachiella sp. 5M10]|uniref:caspase family protein n=1 Tax=Reichenbachiella sp. 5M10 TaxID=1889772 RepID=UPI000C14E14E|nr:caspase family protein [Reichenbachiella sp. 5M10]PIB36950.1 hypothetical protein BFP72_16840 [Reichenbachiella sp. 5M10]
MSLKSFFAFVLFLYFTNVTAAEKRLALVIGNSAYQYVTALNNPTHDAHDISDKLSKLGFDVMTYTDLGHDSLISVMKTYGKRLKDYETGLFYYAGHAIEISGKNYFVPIDAKVSSIDEVTTENVPVNGLILAMKYSYCKTKIVIMDACRNNPFTFAESDKISGGLALMDAPQGSIICFSTSPGKTAADGSGRNGLYTEAILKYIQSPGLEIGDLFHQVRSYVLKASDKKQIPWETTSLTEPFVFNVIPEMSLQVRIIEGESVTFEGLGFLHAQSNIKGVTYQWFDGDKVLKNNATLEVRKSGRYHVRAVSPQGQISSSEEIIVRVNSLVKPSVRIVEGNQASFEGFGTLHAQTNTSGTFAWYRDGARVNEGHDLMVSASGNYKVELNTFDGRKTSSDFIKVKVSKPSVSIILPQSGLFQSGDYSLQDVLSNIYNCTLYTTADQAKPTEKRTAKQPQLTLLSDPTEHVLDPTLKLIIPLYSQYIGIYSSPDAKTVQIAFVREQDQDLVPLVQKFLQSDISFIPISAQKFENLLHSEASNYLFLYGAQSLQNMEGFQQKYLLTSHTEYYAPSTIKQLQEGALRINTYLAAPENIKLEKNNLKAVQQFFALRDNQPYFDFSVACQSILGSTDLTLHKALFTYLNQHPNTCR